jgi:hypothetical protein
MRTNCGKVLTFAASWMLACSSSGGGASSGNADGGTSNGIAGAVTFSCTSADLCTEILAPPSAMAAELQVCNMQMGTFGTGCSTVGVIGCCVHGIETQCSYNALEAMVDEELCAKMDGGWSMSDGGSVASGAGAFVGTWVRSGTQTVTCPTGAPTTSMITGNLVIALGSTTGAVTGTQPDGCVTNYVVSGNVATAAPGQACNVTTEAGIAETDTVIAHTLTMSADGMTLTSMSSETIDKTATMTMCSAMSSGTYTKQ